MSTERPRYLTIYKSIGGWKVVELWWNPDMGGFYEPWQTGTGWATPEEADADAQCWAAETGLEYRRPRDVVIKTPPPADCACGHPESLHLREITGGARWCDWADCPCTDYKPGQERT